LTEELEGKKGKNKAETKKKRKDPCRKEEEGPERGVGVT